MHRIDGYGATTDNKFTDGNPATGTAATVVTDDFMNAVQEEIAAVIEGAGIALNKLQNDQLLEAINSLIAAAVAGDTSASVEYVDAAIATVWYPGDYKITIRNTADPGWVLCNDGTIGNASSGATTRANADTQALFEVLWASVGDTYAPVSGGRGASAAADFAANKTIALTKMLGRALAVAGAGTGLTTRTLGQTLGSETETLTVDQLPSHTHTVPLGIDGSGGDHNNSGTASFANTGSGITTGTAGTGAAHNNMPPETFINVMMKL